MKFLIATVLLLGLNAQAFADDPISCRHAVVNAGAVMGEAISPMSFSLKTPSEFELSQEEFNELPANEQNRLYYVYMPIETMVANMRSRVAREISAVNSSPLAFLYSGYLSELRAQRDNLDACI